MAPQSHTSRVRLARELLRQGKVDAVVAHGQPCAIEAGRARTADVHHHVVQVAVRAMRDLVLVGEAQSLVRTFSIGGGEVRSWLGEDTYLERLADVVDHVRAVCTHLDRARRGRRCRGQGGNVKDSMRVSLARVVSQRKQGFRRQSRQLVVQ